MKKFDIQKMGELRIAENFLETIPLSYRLYYKDVKNDKECPLCKEEKINSRFEILDL